MDPLRAQALERARGLEPTPKALERVAATVGADASRWAFTQWELRHKARAKFSRAEEMIFVREALEQATRSEIAHYHASRFPAEVLVADLTCGIGADLIALAERGPVLGYELDRERAACAQHNLAVYGSPGDVLQSDSLEASWPDYVLADPARRVGGARRLDPSQFTPDPTVLAARMASLKLGGIKLTPLLKDSYLEALGPELAFVASADECPEVVVWTGSEAQQGRYAVFAGTGQRLTSGSEPAQTATPRSYLMEAHPAAIRAHGLGTLCETFDLWSLGDSNGYLVGDNIAISPWLKAYRVLEATLPDVRAVKKVLRTLGSGTPIVKSRAGVDVEALRREWKLEGEKTLIVAAYLVGKGIRYAILTEA